VGKPEGRWPLGRLRRRWLDNIRMDLVEVGWVDVDSIGLTQDRDRWRPQVAHSIRKVGINFADKRRSLDRYSSLADSGHGVFCMFSVVFRFAYIPY
jgi:hypothetical protein